MIFTAYIDESDTHGATPDMTMSATLGSGRGWELFGRRLSALQREHEFNILHAVDFKSRDGEFANWPDWKFSAVYNALGMLARKHLIEAVSVRLTHDVYKAHFLDVLPRKMHRSSQYGILFLALLDSLTKRVVDEGKNHRLSVVVENGHPNAGDTRRLFQERQREWEEAGVNFLKSHTLASKKESRLLMISDVSAHAIAMEWRAIKSGKKAPFAERKPTEPVAGEAGWTVSEVTPKYLASLIDQFNQGKVAKHDSYLRRKAAFISSRGEG